MSGWSALMSASNSGRRSSQRSARLRMLSVATVNLATPLVCRLDGDGDRQRERERRPDPLLGFDPDPAAVLLQDVPRDRQAQAGAAAPDAGPVDLVEALEDPALVGFRDADPLVGDRDDDLAVVSPGPDRHVAAAVGAELHRVVEEVDDDLADPSLIAPDPGQAIRDVDDEPQALPLREEPETLRGLRCDPAEVDVVDQHERPTALDPGKVEQLVDHLDEMAGLDLDLRDPVAHLERHRRAGAVGIPGQRLGEEADRRKR